LKKWGWEGKETRKGKRGGGGEVQFSHERKRKTREEWRFFKEE
jgi:hypothetical protein